MNVPLTGKRPFTDYSRWRLVVNDGGRHTWKCLRSHEEAQNWPQGELDKFWLGLDTVSTFYTTFDAWTEQYRVCRTCPNQKTHLTRLGMDTNSIRTCKLTMGIGLENMEDPCFSFQDLSLARMSQE